MPDADESAFNEAIQAATQPNEKTTTRAPETVTPDSPSQESSSLSSPKSRHPGRQPSVSIQSKLRSTSFRDAAPGPVSPSPGTLQRVEELERDNNRLAQEAAEIEARWRKAEEDLEELREESTGRPNEEIEKLRAEVEVLKRQQRQNSASNASGLTRASRRESISTSLTDDHSFLQKELESKDSTIADMQLEISRLRSQLSSQTAGCETHGEQISALSTSLSSTETRLRNVESELSDSKKALAKASERAVADGTERTSKETKIRSLERDLSEATTKFEEIVKKAVPLEKMIEAMNKLHRASE